MIRTAKRKYLRLRILLNRRHRLLGQFFHIFAIICAAFILILLFTYTIFQPYYVVGQSMEPSLKEGNRLFVLRLGKITYNVLGTDYIPKRGEIIVFKHPDQKDKLIKRVIGLPGEQIIIENKKIKICNEEFPCPQGFEPNFNFDPQIPPFPDGEPRINRKIGLGEIFVLGDNREQNGSLDSRDIGNISLEDVDGTVMFRVIPFKIF